MRELLFDPRDSSPHSVACKGTWGPRVYSHREGTRTPTLVHTCPSKQEKLTWFISLHAGWNGRTKSYEKFEGMAYLQTLHLTMLTESGEIGQNDHTAVQSLFCAFSKLPPPSCSPGSHTPWREGWAAIRSAGGRNKGALSPSSSCLLWLEELCQQPGWRGGCRCSLLLCLQTDARRFIYLSLSTGHSGHSACSLLPCLNNLLNDLSPKE